MTTPLPDLKPGVFKLFYALQKQRAGFQPMVEILKG
jgi:hypothetical protein